MRYSKLLYNKKFYVQSLIQFVMMMLLSSLIYAVIEINSDLEIFISFPMILVYFASKWGDKNLLNPFLNTFPIEPVEYTNLLKIRMTIKVALTFTLCLLTTLIINFFIDINFIKAIVVLSSIFIALGTSLFLEIGRIFLKGEKDELFRVVWLTFVYYYTAMVPFRYMMENNFGFWEIFLFYFSFTVIGLTYTYYQHQRVNQQIAKRGDFNGIID